MVEIHYFAAARAARGVAQETLPDPGSTLADLLGSLGTAHTDTTAGGTTLAQVFERCGFLIDGRTVTHADATTTPLDGVQRVDVLPPFAGG
ncbi:MAG TPA: MoaD/ThiS family protein [Candidatus Corynebacterium avicola]|uniref:MoaD/ThiS family protein n=1 Tax=Candidatus Corynebacterium avicola TaxID=2838527 RepID=A0A9D1RQE1_9CORY|nr:MoaD/ThiS family protein [Candidatus Corynebacterium avicola]